MIFFFFLWRDPEMSFKAKVFINDLKWENKMLQMELKEMHKLKDRNVKGTNEIKEVQ